MTAANARNAACTDTKDKISVCVFVSGGGTNLQALLDESMAGHMPSAEISLVVSDKETAFALTRAKNAGVETAVVDYKKAGSQEAFEKQLLSLLGEKKIGVIVLAGFLRILSEDFVRRFPERILNVHPSLIPSFCGKGFYGLKVHEAALSRGVKVTGATVHFVNEIPDGGKIVMQKAVSVQEGDTPEILQQRVMREAEWILLPAATEKVCGNLLSAKKQGDRT